MRKGFTLIELSIVLVIIGLLAGGILVGQELMKAAEIRATVAQIEKYDTAVQTFRTKFDCLPGDCMTAVSLGLGVANGAGDFGNGDGIIWGDLVSLATLESMNMWRHLSLAGMVDGTFPGISFVDMQNFVPSSLPIPVGIYFPQTKLGKGGLWVSQPYIVLDSTGITNVALSPQHYFWITGDLHPGHGDQTYPGALTPEENYRIDSKIDDGFPVSGKVTVSYPGFLDLWIVKRTDTGAIYGPGGASANVCAANNVTPAQYNVQNTSGAAATLCVLAIKTTF